MNKYKILTLFLLMNLILSTNTVMSKDKKQNSEITNTTVSTQMKPSRKTLKASVEDYRLEYINKDWWDIFNDPVLKDYILKAVTDNYDLKIASLRVQQSRAAVQEYFGKELPGLDVGGDFARRKTSGTVSMGSFYLPSYTQSGFTLPLNVNYEIDIWGKNRDATKAAKKEFEAVQYNEKASYISLCSSVAATYFNLIGADKQIDIQEDVVKLRDEIYNLTKANNENGLSPTTDLINADKSLMESKVTLNDLKKQRDILLNQLAILTGQSSDDSISLKRSSIDMTNFAADKFPINIKSDVVLKRPDVLSAQAQLQKSKINVNLAKKAFLPDFAITGQLGFNTISWEKMFNHDSAIASWGLSGADSLFSGGQRRARLKGQKYVYDEMIQTYQKTILTAFQEVNDSLASLKYDSQKNKDNLDRLKLEKDNYSLISNKYSYGEISYLDTLQYKERIYTLQREQVATKTACLVDTLSLYKAAGGKY